MKYVTWASVPVISRLVGRFKLQDPPWDPSEAIPLLGAIQPVTNVDDLLRTQHIISVTKDISGATGNTVFYTVPTGKRWQLIGYQRPTTTANSQLKLQEDTGTYLLPVEGSGTTLVARVLEQFIPLPAGFMIVMANTNDIGDAARTLAIMYQEEEA